MLQTDQTIYSLDRSLPPLVLPPSNEPLLPGIPWGDCASPFTPAYWRAQLFLNQHRYTHFRLGRTLFEECVACLLGGHGIPAEVGLAAYRHLLDLRLLDGSATESEYLRALLCPISVGGRTVRYRFAGQKARYLASASEVFALGSVPSSPLALRAWLLQISGIGLKTASWIVRNYCGSDTVAILDVHIVRAGQLANFFPLSANPTTHYLELEAQYLQFCDALGVSAAELDNCIWQQMKENSGYARRLLLSRSNDPTGKRHEARQPPSSRRPSSETSKQSVLPFFLSEPVAA